MKMELEQKGKYLLIGAKGRLDAAWAAYFTDTLLLRIREGQHHLVIDGSEMVFLSSAGIRALLQVYKELGTVDGSFSIANPTDFVEQTLRTSGFKAWLTGFPGDMPADGSGSEGKNSGMQSFILDESAELTVSEPADWRPWQAVDTGRMQTITFSPETWGLGIGSAAGTFEEARDRFGEFLAVCGNVVFQPPGEQTPPDYLIAEKEFIPRLQCIQVLKCTGGMGRLIRFAPAEETSFYTISDLLRRILEQTEGDAAGFVILGEIEGLVGTALIRSPGQIDRERAIGFPEIRDWLTFCGERCHARQTALLTGVVSKTGVTRLPAMPSSPDMAAHVHAAVFPYQPLQNGKVGPDAAVARFFHGPPPLAVMHLADDIRPVVGLGQSALVRGACWFNPLRNPEVLA